MKHFLECLIRYPLKSFSEYLNLRKCFVDDVCESVNSSCLYPGNLLENYITNT